MNKTMVLDESRILFRNDACVVINKLPGEAVEGAGPGMGDLPKLLAECLHINKAVAVNRLDVPVSGCVLFALTPEALAFLNAAFVKGRVEKRYWAALELPPPLMEIPESGELVHWIEAGKQMNKSFAFTEEDKGRKKAILRYRILGRSDHYMFWEIELVTGRQHQIRAQLAAKGLCIKGDLKYGARRSEKNGGIRLHAYSLAFPDPLNAGQRIQVKSPPPEPDNLWKAFDCFYPT
ncbi:RNA pseudouridine synthase [Spirochaetia bacterium]|nr:RNA pseudouridine synthase [Spirochaetia bacterium]